MPTPSSPDSAAASSPSVAAPAPLDASAASATTQAASTVANSTDAPSTPSATTGNRNSDASQPTSEEAPAPSVQTGAAPESGGYQTLAHAHAETTCCSGGSGGAPPAAALTSEPHPVAPLAGDSLLQEAERDVLNSIPPLTAAKGRVEDNTDSDDVILVSLLQ